MVGGCFGTIDEVLDTDFTHVMLGCWTPHVVIAKKAYERTLDVFEYNGGLKKRYGYEEVCVAPPGIGR